MLGSFRIRLFLVLAVVALLLTIFNSGNQARYKVEPVLQYIMEKDYGVDDRLFSLLDSRSPEEQFRPQPVSSPGVVKPPCEGGVIVRHFGWYWNPASQKQEFSPGVAIKLPENSLVRAALGGTVEDITTSVNNGREVRLRHGDDLVSVYKGLREVLVNKGVEISTGQVLGKSCQEFYFELRNQNGPLNPETLFK